MLAGLLAGRRQSSRLVDGVARDCVNSMAICGKLSRWRIEIVFQVGPTVFSFEDFHFPFHTIHSSSFAVAFIIVLVNHYSGADNNIPLLAHLAFSFIYIV